MRPPLNDVAAVVLTRNEEKNIAECLCTLTWADERVVFDQFSTDATPQIAVQSGATLIQHAFVNFPLQRNAALERVSQAWVFFVDADERATPEVGAEVRRVVEESKAGWFVPRHNYMFGKVVRHGGWYPDYQMRLLRRGSARYDPARPVHEVGLLDGEAGYLTNPLIHYNYATVAQFLRKQRQYAQLDARMCVDRGERVRTRSYLGQPLRGLLLALLMAYYAFDRCRRMKKLQSEAAPR
jgi:glycosyltransferase involved in cell wall biosynthesis